MAKTVEQKNTDIFLDMQNRIDQLLNVLIEVERKVDHNKTWAGTKW